VRKKIQLVPDAVISAFVILVLFSLFLLLNYLYEEALRADIWLYNLRAISFFVLVVSLVVIILPLIFFCIGKLCLYVSIAVFCLFNGYKFKVRRVPFASSFKMGRKGDIELTKGNAVFSVHFIDIPYRFRRALIVLDEKNYTLQKVAPGKLRRDGGGTSFASRWITRNVDHSVRENYGNTKCFPELVSGDNAKHVYLVQALPVDSRIVIGSRSESLVSGAKIGTAVFATSKYFKRGLKGQLHDSFFDA